MKTHEINLGIDIGSTTVKLVACDAKTDSIIWKTYQRHETRQADKLLECLNNFRTEHPFRDKDINVYMTGSGGMTLAPILGARFVQEVSAVCAAAEILNPDVGTIVDIGGQDSKIVVFKEDKTTGRKRKIPSMNDKCAGGTGAVLDKISAKLHLSQEELASSPYEGVRLHQIAGKCGVFAETDINGLQKQGVPVKELMASLFDAIVLQNLTVLTRGHTLMPKVILLGGPNSYITGLQQAWEKHIRETWQERNIPYEENSIYAPEDALYYAAFGAIAFCKDEEEIVDFKGTGELESFIASGSTSFINNVQDGLIDSEEELSLFKKAYDVPKFNPVKVKKDELVKGFIGLDIGSTSTKAVLMNTNKKVLAKAYQLSKGNPIDDTRLVLEKLEKSITDQQGKLEVLGLVTTGYAKDTLKEVLKADAAIVETVAHTESALHYYKNVDVICDVGGQDIKIIVLKDGRVKDFKLNTQCSAGNGYFLQSTAHDFGIRVEDYANAAFKATKSPVFGYGCAVFLQSDIVSFQRQGWKKEEIMAGLARVLPKNIWLYVAQIPNFAKLGTNFILQGGTQYNLAAVKAQVDFIKSRFRDKDVKPNIIVHKHCGESGAIGAALEAIRQYQGNHSTSFIGLQGVKTLKFTATTNEATKCRFCKNKCSRTFIDINTNGQSADKLQRIIVGNACEKGSVEDVNQMRAIQQSISKKQDDTANMVNEVNQLMFGKGPLSYPGMIKDDSACGCEEYRRGSVRVGIPRQLLVYSLAPLFRSYFENLGIRPGNIVFSDYTTNQLYRSGCKRGAIDPCFPAKLYLPHLHNLIYKHHQKRPLDIIFSPMVCDVESNLHKPSGKWVCPAVVASSEAAKAALTKEQDLFDEHNIEFVNPFLNLADQELFETQMFRVFKDVLKLTRNEHKQAVDNAFADFDGFENYRQQRGQQVINDLENSGKLGVVVLGRPYHNDPGINHEIFTNLQELGYAVLTQNDLPRNTLETMMLFQEDVNAGIIENHLDISDVWKNSLSTNVNAKLWAAKYVARHPNLVGVEFSNFKCGHDAPTYNVIEAIIEKSGTPFFYFKDMDENKPSGSINLRMETIDYFLKKYRKENQENYYAERLV